MNKYIKLAIGAFVGAGLGYAYYFFIGCSSGSCPLTSNWHITTLYGAVSGLAIAYPGRKKETVNNFENHDEKQK